MTPRAATLPRLKARFGLAVNVRGAQRSDRDRVRRTRHRAAKSAVTQLHQSRRGGPQGAVTMRVSVVRPATHGFATAIGRGARQGRRGGDQPERHPVEVHRGAQLRGLLPNLVRAMVRRTK